MHLLPLQACIQSKAQDNGICLLRGDDGLRYPIAIKLGFAKLAISPQMAALCIEDPAVLLVNILLNSFQNCCILGCISIIISLKRLTAIRIRTDNRDGPYGGGCKRKRPVIF